MTAADMASISEQPDVYQELVEASFIFSTIMQVLCMQYKIVYRKIGILSMEWCLSSKLAARMGAYFHGVLISAYNFLVARCCVGTD